MEDYSFQADFYNKVHDEYRRSLGAWDDGCGHARQLGPAERRYFRKFMNPDDPDGESFLDMPGVKESFLDPAGLLERPQVLQDPCVMKSFIYRYKCQQSPQGGTRSALYEVKAILVEHGESGALRAANKLIESGCLSKTKYDYGRLYPDIAELLALLCGLSKDEKAALIQHPVALKRKIRETRDAAGQPLVDALEKNLSGCKRKELYAVLVRLYDPLMHLAIRQDCLTYFENNKSNKSGTALDIIDRYCRITGYQLSNGFPVFEAAQSEEGQKSIERFYENVSTNDGDGGGDNLFIPLAVDSKTGATLCILGRNLVYDIDDIMKRDRTQVYESQSIPLAGFGRKSVNPDLLCYYVVYQPNPLEDECFETLENASSGRQSLFDMGLYNCTRVMYGVDWDKAGFYDRYDKAREHFDRVCDESLDGFIWDQNGTVPDDCPEVLRPFFKPRPVGARLSPDEEVEYTRDANDLISGRTALRLRVTQ